MYEASPSALTHSVIWVHSNYTLSWFNFSCIHLEIYLLFIYIYVFRCSGLMECKFLKDSYGCMNFLSVCFNVIFWTLLLLTYIFAVFLFVSLAKVLSNFLNKQFSLKKKTIYSFLIYGISAGVSRPSSPTSSSSPQPLLIHFPSEKGSLPGIATKCACQVIIKVGTSPHIKGGQSNPVGEKGYKAR